MAKFKIIERRYRMDRPPTESMFRMAEDWNRSCLHDTGLEIRYEERQETQYTWNGPQLRPVWYMVLRHDIHRSGALRPRIGRPPKELPPPEVIKARQEAGCSMYAMAREYGVSRATLYRHLAVDSD